LFIVIIIVADDLTLLLSTIVGLENELNVLATAAAKLSLTVNLEKSKVVVFRKGFFFGTKRKMFFFAGGQLEVVNSFGD
jgi:hypothetical protein